MWCPFCLWMKHWLAELKTSVHLMPLLSSPPMCVCACICVFECVYETGTCLFALCKLWFWEAVLELHLPSLSHRNGKKWEQKLRPSSSRKLFTLCRNFTEGSSKCSFISHLKTTDFKIYFQIDAALLIFDFFLTLDKNNVWAWAS